MTLSVNKVWRLFATALGFIVFGLAVLLLALFVFLFVYLPSWRDEDKQLWMRSIICYACGFYVKMLNQLGLMTYDYQYIERLAKGRQLVVANHPSLIDILILLSLVPNASCIIKAEMVNSRLIFGIASLAGYIPNNDENLIARAVAVLEQGDSLIIFPEGTRTVPGGKIKLLRGAANIAVRSRCSLAPVLIQFHPCALLKEQRWYDIPDRRVHIVVRVMPALSIDDCIDGSRPATIQARHLTSFLENYFQAELSALSTN